jgi:hypothetical protein
MTKTTEELKREMFKALAEMKGRIEINYSIKDMLRGVDEFEHALEGCLQSMREDHDTLRNKLQAFEFANRSAAELLSEALREPSGLRKTSQAIPQQESVDRGSCAKCRAVELRNPPIQRKKCTHPWAWRTHSQADECFVCRKCGTSERDF